MDLDRDITVTFSRDQALVMSDWLHDRLGTTEFDGLVDRTDRAAWSPIYAIKGTLEHELTEIFMPDYTERLAAARERLLDSLGSIGRPEIDED